MLAPIRERTRRGRFTGGPPMEMTRPVSSRPVRKSVPIAITSAYPIAQTERARLTGTSRWMWTPSVPDGWGPSNSSIDTGASTFRVRSEPAITQR